MLKLKNISINENTTILIPSSYLDTDDIKEYLNNKCSVITINSKSNLSDIPNSFLTAFGIQNLKTKFNLTWLDELKIGIVRELYSPNNTVVFFNVLGYLDEDFKSLILDYLQTIDKLIINYTTNIEEALLFDYLIVKDNDKIIMEGKTKEILNEDKILNKLGFKIPIIVELSNGLKHYGITDKTYCTNESLVNALWK